MAKSGSPLLRADQTSESYSGVLDQLYPPHFERHVGNTGIDTWVEPLLFIARHSCARPPDAFALGNYLSG